MKIREKRAIYGMGGSGEEERVREVPEGEPPPENAETVPDETEVYDWRPVS